jgi:putative two-component system response regulator
MSSLPPVPTHSRILIVDDEEPNVRYLERLLDMGGYDEVYSASNGSEALASLAKTDPDLILLDLHMPQMDGYQVLRTLREVKTSDIYLPILVFTADATHESRKKALELGASDFLTKPGDATELLLRVKNFLTMRHWSRALSERNQDLEVRVRERTRELEEAQIEIVERLAMAGEHRDDDTGHHTTRVGRISGDIARCMGLSELFAERISLAARLHDLGKVAISDTILLKPGKLTTDEFETMKVHSAAGARILSNGKTPLIQMAQRIAAAHHEKFNGSGYPLGLRGDEIPIEARIVAVADAFDALTHDRPYKKAWDRDAAAAEIRASSGTHFDPVVVDGFFRMFNEPGSRASVS